MDSVQIYCDSLLLSEPGPVEFMPVELKLNREVHTLEVAEDFTDSTVASNSKSTRSDCSISVSHKRRLQILLPVLELKVKAVWPDVNLKSNIVSLCHGIGTSVTPENSDEDHCKPGESPLDPRLPNNHMQWGWDSDQFIGFKDSGDRSVALIGVLKKHQPIKSSLMHRLCHEVGLPPIPTKNCLRRESYLMLNDGTAGIRLRVREEDVELKFHEIISGVVCAVMGKCRNGRLEVEDVIYPTPERPIWPAMSENNVEMVFISGLNFGKTEGNSVYLELLLDYLQGLAGSPDEQEYFVKRKTRLFVVGNSFTYKKQWNLPSQTKIAKKLDNFFNQLALTMEVFVLPGVNDPTPTPALPQPPMHPSVFITASQRPTFQRLSNPARVRMCVSNSEYKDPTTAMYDDNIEIMLCSGKNVTDSMYNSNFECPMEMSKMLLKWAHIYPMSTETRPLYHGTCEDAFVVRHTLPHLFIVGNQPEFGIKEWNNVKIVALPEFVETNTAVILNRNMTIIPISFNIFLKKRSIGYNEF